ncbi:MAG TPA: hypothetical protein VMJ33_04705 [Gallionella sp.]|nr:hypothetical protein [Gallionella sp.]
MKLKALFTACTLAFAGQAFALDATSVTPDVTLFLSGSSASQKVIGQVAKSIMDPATMDDYFDLGTTSNGSSYRAYFGRANAAAIAAYPSLESTTPGVGKKIMLYETAAGGSIKGVNPVQLSQAVNRIGFTGCVAAGTDSVTGAPLHTCTGVDTTHVPDVGISDVEPADLEAAVNLPAGTLPLSASDLAAITANSHPTIAQVMGIAVTTNLSLTNLSKGAVASLMGGTVTDFNVIDSSATAGKTTIVCRRVAGSGTQATINAAFFGNPCMTGQLPPADHTASSMTTGTVPNTGNYIVIEGDSSGKVQGCLTAALNGTPAGKAISLTTGTIASYTGSPPAGSVVLNSGNYGIGLIGLDSGVPAEAKFVSINGTAPSVANASTGSYDVWVESTFNDRGLTTGTDQGDFYALFQKNSGDPTILGTGGSGGTPIAGVAALSENGWVSTSFNPAYPVMRVGNFASTCSPFQQLQ